MRSERHLLGLCLGLGLIVSVVSGSAAPFHWVVDGSSHCGEHHCDYAQISSNAATSDGDGGALITGWVWGENIMFGGFSLSKGEDGSPLRTDGNDVLLAKVDNTGTPVWAFRAGGNSEEEGLAIAADGAGGAFVAGSISSNNFGAAPLNNFGDSARSAILVCGHVPL